MRRSTVVEFGDLQCPVCKDYSEQILPEVIEGPVRSGDAKLEFRNWTIIGPDSEDAAKAALAASEQGRYWSFITLFYRNQGAENSGYVSDSFLEAVAEGAGVRGHREVGPGPPELAMGRADSAGRNRGRAARVHRHAVLPGRGAEWESAPGHAGLGLGDRGGHP